MSDGRGTTATIARLCAAQDIDFEKIGYYELTRSKEDVSAGKSIVLYEPATGNIAVDDHARAMIGSSATVGIDGLLAAGVVVFVQTTSSTRKLDKGARFLVPFNGTHKASWSGTSIRIIGGGTSAASAAGAGAGAGRAGSAESAESAESAARGTSSRYAFRPRKKVTYVF